MKYLYNLSISIYIGYVTTIFGRRRLLPGINSADPHLRSQSERQAVNFVIQGMNSMNSDFERSAI